MPEWWSYTLQDLVMVSPRAYLRLLERHNAALWPAAHAGALALGLAIPALMLGKWRWRGQAVGLILAACWIWVATSFLLGPYATLHWAAPWFAALFALQAVLLVAVGITAPVARAPMAAACFAAVLLLYPFAGLPFGRSLYQAEAFAVLPDPTAVATLAILGAVPYRAQWLLAPLPVLWCVLDGATLWAMEAPGALVPPIAAALALATLIRRR